MYTSRLTVTAKVKHASTSHKSRIFSVFCPITLILCCNCIQQYPCWEADRRSARLEIRSIYLNQTLIGRLSNCQFQRRCSSHFEADLKNWGSGCRGRRVDLWTRTAARSSRPAAVTGTHTAAQLLLNSVRRRKRTEFGANETSTFISKAYPTMSTSDKGLHFLPN